MADSLVDRIQLRANGSIFEDWTTAKLTRSIEGLCGEFEFVITDKQGGQQTRWPIVPQDVAQIYLEADKMLTGYVETLTPSADDNGHSILVKGRDKTCDLIDCGIDWPPPKFGKIGLLALAKRLCAPFKIEVVDKANTTGIFSAFEINKGESVFEALDRACRLKGVYPMTDAEGRLIFTTGSIADASDELVWGDNIKSFSAPYDYKNRFRTYRVHGQSPLAPGDFLGSQSGGTTGAVGKAEDPEIKRYRPIIIAAEGNISSAQAKKRAEFEVSHRKGLSQSITLTVQGWRQHNGDLWQPGLRVYVNVPPAYVKGTLIITECTWNKNPGATTTMTLKTKEAVEAFGIKAAVKKKKGGMGLFQDLLRAGTDTPAPDAEGEGE